MNLRKGRKALFSWITHVIHRAAFQVLEQGAGEVGSRTWSSHRIPSWTLAVPGFSPRQPECVQLVPVMQKSGKLAGFRQVQALMLYVLFLLQGKLSLQ